MQSPPKTAPRTKWRASLLRAAVRSAGILGVCLSATVLVETSARAGVIYSWVGTTDGLWSDITTPRWSPSTAYPNASDATADFSAQNITGDITVHLDTTPVTVNQLIFGDTDPSTAGGWILDNNGSSANVLTLGGTTPTITVNALGTGKAATISANLSATAFTVGGAGKLVLSGQLLTSGAVVTKTSAATGALTIQNANNNFVLTGSVNREINGTTTVTDGTVVLGSGGALYVGRKNASTLTIGGAASASTPAGTNLLVGFNDTGAAPTAAFTGQLNLNNTASLTVNGDLKLGETDGTAGASHQVAGTMVVNTSGTLSVTGKLYVGTATYGSGKRAQGNMTLTMGTVNVTSDLKLTGSGDSATGGGYGKATLLATGGTLTVGGNMPITGSQRTTTAGSATATIQNLTEVQGSVTLNAGGTNSWAPATLSVNANGTLRTQAITLTGTDATLNLGDATTAGTLVALVNNDNFISGTGNSPYIGTGGVVVDTNGYSIGIPVALSNASGNTGQLTKKGVGTLTLTTNHSYSGATNVTAGVLRLSGAGAINSSSGITVNGATARLITTSTAAITAPTSVVQGTIGGSGDISAAGGVSIGAGATVSPGAGPGSQNYTTGLTFAGGGTYAWEINDANGAAGTNYDIINVTGFNLTADSSTPFTIALNAFNATNTPGILPNFDNTLAYNWELLAANTTISNFADNYFTLAPGNFVTLNDLAGGSFKVVRGDAPGVGGTDKQLWLSYSPAPLPEPASLALLALGAALLPWRRGRNRA